VSTSTSHMKSVLCINPSISEHTAYHYRSSGPLLSVTHRREMTSLSRRKKEIEESRRALSEGGVYKGHSTVTAFSTCETSFQNTCAGETKHQEDGRSDVCELSDSQRKGKSSHIQLKRCTTELIHTDMPA